MAIARPSEGEKLPLVTTPASAPIRVNASGSYRIEFHGPNQRVLGRLPSLGDADLAAEALVAPGVASGWFSVRAEPDAPFDPWCAGICSVRLPGLPRARA